MFFCEKVSEAAPNTATSLSPLARADSRPRRFGTRADNLACGQGESFVESFARTSAVEAICGAGLELLLVQHVRYPGWDPAKENGDFDAAAALT